MIAHLWGHGFFCVYDNTHIDVRGIFHYRPFFIVALGNRGLRKLVMATPALVWGSFHHRPLPFFEQYWHWATEGKWLAHDDTYIKSEAVATVGLSLVALSNWEHTFLILPSQFTKLSSYQTINLWDTRLATSPRCTLDCGLLALEFIDRRRAIN